MPRLTNKQVEEIEERIERKKKERLAKITKDIERNVPIPEHLKVNWRV